MLFSKIIVVNGKNKFQFFTRYRYQKSTLKSRNPRVAVPGRNRALFRCIFRAYYRIRSAVTQYFRYRRGSYALCKLMNTWHVYAKRMGPTPKGSSALQRFECDNALEIRNGIMFDFYPGLPQLSLHNVFFIWTCTITEPLASFTGHHPDVCYLQY